jgi:hypothetical protein
MAGDNGDDPFALGGEQEPKRLIIKSLGGNPSDDGVSLRLISHWDHWKSEHQNEIAEIVDDLVAKGWTLEIAVQEAESKRQDRGLRNGVRGRNDGGSKGRQMTRMPVRPVIAATLVELGPVRGRDNALSLAQLIINELWGAGYMIINRNRDPFDVPEHIIPRGMAYQWCSTVPEDLAEKESKSWRPVPASRHDGLFMPAGTEGDIVVGTLVLMERAKDDVDAYNRQAREKAERQGDELLAKYASDYGISGHVRVGEKITEFGDNGQHTQVRIPAELTPYLSELFAERDAILARSDAPTLLRKKTAMELAISVVHDRHFGKKEGQPDGTPAQDTSTSGAGNQEGTGQASEAAPSIAPDHSE